MRSVRLKGGVRHGHERAVERSHEKEEKGKKSKVETHVGRDVEEAAVSRTARRLPLRERHLSDRCTPSWNYHGGTDPWGSACFEIGFFSRPGFKLIMHCAQLFLSRLKLLLNGRAAK